MFTPHHANSLILPSDKARITSCIASELTVEADHQFSVDFDIQGDPPPSITWKYNGGPLEGRAVDVMEEDGKARLLYSMQKEGIQGFMNYW